MFKLFVLFFTTSLFASTDCEFGYDRFGENLLYKCGMSEKKITFKNKKIFIEEKEASSALHESYHQWKKQSQKDKADFKKQKDQFLCH